MDEEKKTKTYYGAMEKIKTYYGEVDLEKVKNVRRWWDNTTQVIKESVDHDHSKLPEEVFFETAALLSEVIPFALTDEQMRLLTAIFLNDEMNWECHKKEVDVPFPECWGL